MPGPHGGRLSVIGLCAYCEAPTGRACALCGRAMCADHAVEPNDVCVGCGGRAADD